MLGLWSPSSIDPRFSSSFKREINKNSTVLFSATRPVLFLLPCLSNAFCQDPNSVISSLHISSFFAQILLPKSDCIFAELKWSEATSCFPLAPWVFAYLSNPLHSVSPISLDPLSHDFPAQTKNFYSALWDSSMSLSAAWFMVSIHCSSYQMVQVHGSLLCYTLPYSGASLFLFLFYIGV